MDTADREFVVRSLEQSELTMDDSVRLQKLGDPAFDFLAGMIARRELSPDAQVTALRRLSLLTRQQCQERKEELLDIAVGLLADDELVVRSGAVNMAINTVLILEGLSARAVQPQNHPGALRQRIQEAVKAALGRGLDSEQASYARDFVANRI